MDLHFKQYYPCQYNQINYKQRFCNVLLFSVLHTGTPPNIAIPSQLSVSITPEAKRMCVILIKIVLISEKKRGFFFCFTFQTARPPKENSLFYNFFLILIDFSEKFHIMYIDLLKMPCILLLLRIRKRKPDYK